MAYLMSLAQIERDFSGASLVLLLNKVSMHARYFQTQLCSLVNFLHLVHAEAIQRICLLNPCHCLWMRHPLPSVCAQSCDASLGSG